MTFLGPGVNVLVRLLSGVFGAWFFINKLSLIGPIKDAFNKIEVLGSGPGDLPGAILYSIILPIFGAIGYGLFATIIPGLIIGLCILLTIFLLMLRIFVLLFKAYLEILLLVIFAPIILLFEAIPGRSVFSFWLKNLVVNLLTFPIVIVLFLIGWIIVNKINVSGTVLWQPPFLGGTTISSSAFSVLVGMGLIFLIPDIVKMVKELLGVKGIPLNVGPGMFFAGAGTAVGGGIGVAGQFGSLSLAGSAIGRVKQFGMAGFFGKDAKTAAEGAKTAVTPIIPPAQTGTEPS